MNMASMCVLSLAAAICASGERTSSITGAAARQVPPTGLQQPQDKFINVEGQDLKSRAAAAIKLGSAQPRRFWVAYTFDVRPGVAFDAVFMGPGGSTTILNGAGVGSRFETRNLGVFLLHESGTHRILRAEIYNLDRPHDYSGHPVYWLGRGAGEESLPLLRGLVDIVQTSDVGERLVDAIAAHNEPRVVEILRNVIGSTKNERARTTAVSWLGHFPEQTEFLAKLVRDEREHVAVRREAADALGAVSDPAVLPVLRDLYGAVTHREVKGELLDAIAGERFEAEAIAFLIQTSEQDQDHELRATAIEALGERTDAVSFQALEKAASNPQSGVELQRAAVEAISERSDDGALPLLKKIAKSHPRGSVREEALERLGERPEQLPFLVELASDRGEGVDLRRSAIEAIAQSENTDAVAALKQLFASANHPELKEEIVDAIADSADRPGAISFLLGIAQSDGDRDVRESALSALGDMEDERAVAALMQMYDSLRDEEAKNGVLDALGEADSPRALEKLLNVAQRDPSVRLRKRAIELLSETDNPAAIRFLEQLLK